MGAMFQGGIKRAMYTGLSSKGEKSYDGRLHLLKKRGDFMQRLLCCRYGSKTGHREIKNISPVHQEAGLIWRKAAVIANNTLRLMISCGEGKN